MKQTFIEKTTNIQGPVVQSIISLTSSLRVISLTVLADSIYNILTFFAEKKTVKIQFVIRLYIQAAWLDVIAVRAQLFKASLA